MSVLRDHHSFSDCIVRLDHQPDIDIDIYMIWETLRIAHTYDCIVREDHQFDIDVDREMIWVIQRDHS